MRVLLRSIRSISKASVLSTGSGRCCCSKQPTGFGVRRFRRCVTGRALSALFDSLTVGLTFLISRRVLPRHWALFAATLVALAALHVQQSHFFTVDNFAAFWMLAAFWGGARWQDTGRARDALLAGVALGIAMACKISAIFIGVPLLMVLLLFGVGKHPRRQVTVGALGCALVALVCFRVFQPMAFVGAWGFFDMRPDGRFWDGIASQAAITRGAVDVPFNVQWIGRAPWLFSLRNLGFWGYGWGLLISGALGALMVLWKWRERDEKAPILLASALFCAVLFGVQGATFSKFTRYFLPMTPLLALLASLRVATARRARALVARRRAPGGGFYGVVVRGGRGHLRADASANRGFGLDRDSHRARHARGQRNAVGRGLAVGRQS